MRTLQVTTPYMHGADVRQVQVRLAHSPYGNFLKGAAIDGEYGPMTAQAVYRAKYWMGAKPNHAIGDGFMPYLSGKAKLTARMRVRRAVRLRRKLAKPIRLKALAQMKQLVGMKEVPAFSNRCPVTAWYGVVGPWCAMGVSYAYVKAGSKAFARGSRYAACFQIIADARAGRNGLTLTHSPAPGDLVLMRWPGSKWEADHVGMVEIALPERLITIECNTSPDNVGSQANGGGCYRRDRTGERRSGIVVMYVHVGK